MKLLVLALLITYALSDCPPQPPVECQGSDLLCGGEQDSKGCPTAQWCLPVDPYAHCSAKAECPRTCDENSYLCNGGKDPEGCQMPASCFAKDLNCV